MSTQHPRLSPPGPQGTGPRLKSGSLKGTEDDEESRAPRQRRSDGSLGQAGDLAKARIVQLDAADAARRGSNYSIRLRSTMSRAVPIRSATAATTGRRTGRSCRIPTPSRMCSARAVRSKTRPVHMPWPLPTEGRGHGFWCRAGLRSATEHDDIHAVTGGQSRSFKIGQFGLERLAFARIASEN